MGPPFSLTEFPMADAPPKYDFSAEEERLQREARRKDNAARLADVPQVRAQREQRAAKRAAFDTAFGADQAQKAREAAAKTMRNTRAMPSAFPVGGEPQE